MTQQSSNVSCRATSARVTRRSPLNDFAGVDRFLAICLRGVQRRAARAKVRRAGRASSAAGRRRSHVHRTRSIHESSTSRPLLVIEDGIVALVERLEQQSAFRRIRRLEVLEQELGRESESAWPDSDARVRSGAARCGRPCRAGRSSSPARRQSSKACDAPCPIVGNMGCAASPSRAARRPSCQCSNASRSESRHSVGCDGSRPRGRAHRACADRPAERRAHRALHFRMVDREPIAPVLALELGSLGLVVHQRRVQELAAAHPIRHAGHA